MTNKDIKNQLMILQNYAESRYITDGETVWLKNSVALNNAIRIYERKEKKFSGIGMKILFVLDLAVFIGSIVLALFALGGYQDGLIGKQGFLLRIMSYALAALLSGTSMTMIWLGVGDE